MLSINWSDPQTLWLNLTNLALGIATLLGLGVLAMGVFQEVWARRRRAREIDGLDAEMHHMLHVPELGLTMADGGEPLPEAKPEQTEKKSEK